MLRTGDIHTRTVSRNSDRGVIPCLSLLVRNASFVLTRSVGNAYDGRLESLINWRIKDEIPRKENVLTRSTQGDDNAILTDVLNFQLASGHLDVTDDNHTRAQIPSDCITDPSPRTGVVRCQWPEKHRSALRTNVPNAGHIVDGYGHGEPPVPQAHISQTRGSEQQTPLCL